MVDNANKQAKNIDYKARQRQYNAKYDALNMKTFSVKIRLELNEKLEQHIEYLKLNDSNANRNKFVTDAIREKLERDTINNIENITER